MRPHQLTPLFASANCLSGIGPRMEILLKKALRLPPGVGEPRVHGSIADLVADPNVDALWIATTNDTRIAVVEEIVDAVKSGKGELIGVACEKPLARNLAEARDIDRDLFQQLLGDTCHARHGLTLA